MIRRERRWRTARGKLRVAFRVALVCLAPPMAFATEWVRPGMNSGPGLWGIEGGLKFAISPYGFTGGNGGPRGLIRLGYPVHPGGGYDLINFIAVEPVVNGHKGFSELERSQLDDVQGKRMWTDNLHEPGNLWNPEPGVEQLDVLLRVERFLNGAHAYLMISQRSDAPDEIRLAIHAEPGSAPMEYCILTATMGNKVRARELWINQETVSSLELYPSYRGSDFAPHSFYDLGRLRRTAEGGVIAAITTDEEEGTRVVPWPAAAHWNYRGAKVTQYWRKPKGTFRGDLHVAVNARYTYWMSNTPIPGGISYENFEMRERFFEGQSFTFGITRKTPAEIGLGAATAVAHFRFEEGEAGSAATEAFDSSGSNHHLEIEGEPVFSSDVPVATLVPPGRRNGLAMEFGEGLNGMVGKVDEGLSLVDFEDFTVEAWVRLHDLEGWQTLVARLDSTGRRRLGPEPLFQLAKGGADNRFHLKLAGRDGSWMEIAGGPAVEQNTWYHVAAVGDAGAGKISLYVNRQLVATEDGFTGLYRPSPAVPWAIGRSSYDGNPLHWLNGTVDEIRISDVALEPARFLAEFSITGQPEDVVAWSGEDVEFSGKVVGTVASYQWEVSTDEGSTWAAISGATEASYRLESVPHGADRNQYRLVVVGRFGETEISDAALLRVGDADAAPVPRNVVAHYRFDEGNLTSIATGALDSSGNGRHLVRVIGAPRYSSSAPGYGLPRVEEGFSLDLAGGQNAIQGTDGDSLSRVEWNDFTIEAWVRFADMNGWQQIVGRDDRGDQNRDPHSLFRLEKTIDDTYRVVAYGRDGRGLFLDTEYRFVPMVWTHLAVVGDTGAGTMTAFVNGRAAGSVGGFTGLFHPNPRTHWTIGRGQHVGLHFDWVNGQIDEVRFSGAALSPVEFLNFSQAVLHFAAHPEDVSVTGGEEAVFTVLAGGGGQEELVYRWEVSDDGGGTWSEALRANRRGNPNELVTIPRHGDRYRAIASRAGDSAISEVAVASVERAIDAWRQIFFGTIVDAGEAALGADPDGDGLSNLLEYGLGLDPTSAGDSGDAFYVGEDSGILSLTFNHIADPDLIYEVEAASDLVNWAVVKTFGAFSAKGTAQYSEPFGGAKRRFLRLSLTLLQ